MDWLTVSFGVTSSFWQHMMVQEHCVSNYEVFDGCIDATEYVPDGCMVNIHNIPVISSVFAR